jgi:hypothetical protein
MDVKFEFYQGTPPESVKRSMEQLSLNQDQMLSSQNTQAILSPLGDSFQKQSM